MDCKINILYTLKYTCTEVRFSTENNLKCLVMSSPEFYMSGSGVLACICQGEHRVTDRQNIWHPVKSPLWQVGIAWFSPALPPGPNLHQIRVDALLTGIIFTVHHII